MRRALGSPSLLTQAPHITLVPPVNVQDDNLDSAVAVLRAAAEHCARALDFRLGPVVTFSPVSPVLYLQVSGEEETLGRLRRLHDALFVGPLLRRVDFDYVPHVTVHESADQETIEAALVALQEFNASVCCERVQLLRQDPNDRTWRAVADYALNPPVVRGRGGVELHLRWTATAAPDVSRFWSRTSVTPTHAPVPVHPDVAGPWLEARDRVGMLLGVRQSADAVVSDDHLGEGIEEQLLREPTW